MKHSNKPNRNAVWRDLCANFREGDGQPIKQKDSSSFKHERKTQQLCAQVRRAANLAISSTNDKTFHHFYISSCTPIDGPHTLQLTITTADPQNIPPNLSHKLRAITPYIRSEIARSIHRKKVPKIQLVFLPADKLREEI